MGMSRINTRYLFEKSRWAPLFPLFPLLGGLIFLSIFYFRYSQLDKNWFQYVDDGIITMSVGRNIVDYGFAGLNPSGPIVEAASSPLQILIYALSYKLFHIDYIQYSWFQTYVCSFFLGMVFMAFFLEKPWIGLGVSVLAAISLTFLFPFFQWHGSGMENAITHVLFLLTLYLLYRAVKISKVNYFMALPIFGASIVRSESFVHIAPLLIFFSFFWYRHHRNCEALKFSSFVTLFWGIFQLFRYVYFGDVLPNTAYAQEIFVGKRLLSLIKLDPKFIKETVWLCFSVLRKQRAWIALCSIPMLFSYPKKTSDRFLVWSILIVLGSLSVHSLLFGEARIDLARTTTQSTPIIILLIAFSWVFSKNLKWFLLQGGLCGLTALAIRWVFINKPYSIPGASEWVNQSQVKKVESIVKDHSIHRATVANQDIGLISWLKHFNIVDLARLGSPQIARFDQLKDNSATRNYFLSHIGPDIIVAYRGSIYPYCDFMSSDEFQTQYEMLFQKNDLKSYCDKKARGIRFWIRRDIKKDSKSRERFFLDLLQTKLDPAAIKDELSRCYSSSPSCDYVARTAYRFIPELRNMGRFDEVLGFFYNPTDRALLEGWSKPQAHLELIKAVKSKSQSTSFFIMNR